MPDLREPDSSAPEVERNPDGKTARDPARPIALVGLGASAGGIQALQEFFGQMSADSGLAFVVVMHLSPEHESNLAEILQSQTTMPVRQVNEAMKVERDHVYVIPPNKHLSMIDGMVTLSDPQQQTGRRIAIDLFFRTPGGAIWAALGLHRPFRDRFGWGHWTQTHQGAGRGDDRAGAGGSGIRQHAAARDRDRDGRLGVAGRRNAEAAPRVCRE
jgi:hypothetical protein